MKVVIAENRLEVVTGIKKADFDKQVTDMTVKDDKGNVTFKLKVGEQPNISVLGLTCNTTVDKELAVTMILPMETDVEEIKIKYGKALVAAEKNLKVIADRIVADTEAVDGIFADTEEATEAQEQP